MSVVARCAVAIILLLRPVADMPVVAARDGGAAYLDVQGRFHFTVPAGWTETDLVDPGPTAVELDATNPWGIFAVMTDGLLPGMSLERYATDAAEQLRKSLGNARVLPDGIQPTTLGGEPAWAFVVQGRQQGRDVDIFGVVALFGDTVYALTFTTRPEDADAYLEREQIVLTSFTFLTH